MRNDDESGLAPEDQPSAADPLEELERMYGGSLAGDDADPQLEGSSPTDAATEPIDPASDEARQPVAAEVEPVVLADLTSSEDEAAEQASSVIEPEEPASGEGDEPEPVSGPDLTALIAEVDASTPTVAMPGQAAQAAASSRSAKRHIVFRVAETRYALEMGQVTEVGPVPPVTPLPQVPAWLLGVSNLRGDILAVLDLRRFLGHEPTPSDRDRMLVLEAANRTAGLVVDQVLGVAAVDHEAVRAPMAPVEDPVHQFLLGVAEQEDRLLAILDASKLLNSSELRRFAGASSSREELKDPTAPWAGGVDAASPSPLQ